MGIAKIDCQCLCIMCLSKRPNIYTKQNYSIHCIILEFYRKPYLLRNNTYDIFQSND